MKNNESNFERIYNSPDPADEVGILLNSKPPSEVFTYYSDYGGWPENEEIIVEKVEFDEDGILADCRVTFNEMISTGCADMPNPKPRYGRFTLRIDLNGDLEFQYNDLY